MRDIPAAVKLDLDSLTLSKVILSIRQENKPADAVLTAKLGVEATKSLNASPNVTNYSPYRYVEFVYENVDGVVTSRGWKVVVHSVFRKLFEGVNIADVEESVAEHIFSNIIGWDNYFNCPVIVLHDTAGAVVDIIKYRPNHVDYSHLKKYLQKKKDDKPMNRGDKFLYPFQKEMERLLEQEKLVLIGEGLKNAVNALMRSVPYISIESASNTNNPELIEYVNNLDAQGIEIYAALDGDATGNVAFNILNEKFNFNLINIIDFDSGLDFTDYVRKE